MKKEVNGVIDFLFSFLINYDEKKMHNMLSLMLDPIYRSLRIWIGCEQGVIITKKYDRRSLFHTFLKFCYHFHPLLKVDNDLLTKMMRIAIWVQHGWSVKRIISQNIQWSPSIIHVSKS
jgi:hypothetical protein